MVIPSIKEIPPLLIRMEKQWNKGTAGTKLESFKNWNPLKTGTDTQTTKWKWNLDSGDKNNAG